MKQSYDFLINELKKQNIRLSNRRLRVLEYLCQNLNHPTVDQIFTDIQKHVRHLSRTTIYNTLHTLVKARLVRIINIEDNELRYDIVTENHGHFKCEKCSVIFNFKIDYDSLVTDELTGFMVNDKNIYFKGVCPRCLSNNK